MEPDDFMGVSMVKGAKL